MIIPGDFNCDNSVDLADLDTFNQFWLSVNCTDVTCCGNTDLNFDTSVDMFDYAIFARNFGLSNLPPALIDSISPADGEELVFLTREVVVSFEREIDPLLLEPNSISLIANAQTLPGSIQVSASNLFITFTPDDAFPDSTEIQVVVDGNKIFDLVESLAVDADEDGIAGGIATANFTTLPLPIGSTSLTSGLTISAAIDFPGDFDFYTINAAAGETMFLNFGETVASATFNPGVFIYAPNGVRVARDNATTTGTSFTNLALTATGTYTIVVRDHNGNATGDYFFTAVVVDETVDADNVTFISGQTEFGNLATGDIDTFTIDAQAGEALFVNFSEEVGIASFNPGVFIYAPDGTLIASDNATSTGTAFSALSLTATGTYTIVVRDHGSNVNGGYAITAVVVDETVDADNVTFLSGHTELGNLATGDIDTFTIDAATGETLFVNFSVSVPAINFNPGVFIYAPDGTLIDSVDSTILGESFSDLSLTSTGTYTIVVRDHSSNVNGNYAITAVVVDETVDDDNVTLLSGQTELGNLASGDIDTFTIDAAAGETLFVNFSVSVPATNFDPGVFIYAPDDSFLDSVDSTTNGVSFSDLLLTSAGTYTIVVRDHGSNVTGGYAITAVVVDETVDADNVTLLSGQTELGNLATGDIDTFTIDAETGETLFVNFSVSVPTTSFNPGVFIYAPDGTLLDSVVSTTTGVSFSNLALTSTGTYTIVVRDHSSNVTGDYAITAVVVDETVDSDNVTLLSGQTEPGNLALGDIDTFTIDASAGETMSVNFNVSVPASGFNPGVFIYAPNGTLIASDNATTSGTSFTDLALTSTGIYTLVVRDLGSNVTGDYNIIATVVPEI